MNGEPTLPVALRMLRASEERVRVLTQALTRAIDWSRCDISTHEEDCPAVAIGLACPHVGFKRRAEELERALLPPSETVDAEAQMPEAKP